MRNLMISAALLTACGLLAAPRAALAEGDAEAGKVKAYTCTGCHGIPGYNNVYPTYKVPKLGGQNEQYIVSALKAYRAGERHHATMELQARSLSDQDIEDIAAYFVSLGRDH
jgi:cytochrome c553